MSEQMKPLDERGFIFTIKGQPFLCNIRESGEAWLWYWHPDNHWVSHRPISQTEIFMLPHNLTEQQQQLYRDLNQKWMDEQP